MAPMLAADEAEAACENVTAILGRRNPKKDAEYNELLKQVKNFQPAVNVFFRENSGTQLAQWIHHLPDDICDTVTRIVLAETALLDEFHSYPRLRLLIANWAAHMLRIWTRKLKTGAPRPQTRVKKPNRKEE